MSVNDYRLATNVKPLHYDLTIQTDLARKQFSGAGSILLKVAAPTLTTLTFNAHPTLSLHNFSLTSSALKTDSTQQIDASAISRDDKMERVTITLDKALGLKEGDEFRLNLGWKAALGTSMTGFYASSYTSKESGREEFYALTQFEPTDARRAFPCWDEPALKATYSLTLISDAETVNLSNMDVESEGPFDPSSSASPAGEDAGVGKTILKTLKTELKTEGKTEIKTELKTEGNAPAKAWKRTVFKKTPLMSTYLLTWANGAFKYTEDEFKSSDGRTIPIRIYGTSDVVNQTDYVLAVTKRAVPLYEEIFDIPFSLPKLDGLVAADFDAGAMEGWGLITARTTAMLWSKKDGLAAKKRVATVQSHEIAHQWFGDLVTMEWWEQLWLNEAFATFMGEVVVPDRLYPEWNVRTDFLTSHLFRALELDAKRSSHPIEVPCPDANRINEIFDGISYSKGASVLRMLSVITGEEVFLKGVSLYLKENAFGNASTQDLLRGISKASGMEINSIAESWIKKIGFPVLTVTEKDAKLHIRQDRFLSTGDVKPEENETVWQTPLQLLTVSANGEKSIDAKAFLNERETTIDLKGSKLYKLNAGTVGVYRVAYSPSHLELLGEEAAKKDSALSVEDRVGLVSDAHRLSRAGYSSTAGLLSFVSNLKHEDNLAVWSTVASALADLNSVFWEEDKSTLEGVSKLRASLFGPVIDRLGFEPVEGEAPDKTELRSLAFRAAGASGHAPVVDYVKTRFAKFIAGDDSAINPDLRSDTFGLAVYLGGKSEWDAVRKVYKNPPGPAYKTGAMAALCRTQDPELIKATQTMIFEDVKDQDAMYFFAGLSANTKARRSQWQWVQENHDRIYARYEAASLTLSRLISYTDKFSSQADVDEVRAFYASKDCAKFKNSLAQSLEAMEANVKWLSKDAEVVKSWLAENGWSK